MYQKTILYFSLVIVLNSFCRSVHGEGISSAEFQELLEGLIPSEPTISNSSADVTTHEPTPAITSATDELTTTPASSLVPSPKSVMTVTATRIGTTRYFQVEPTLESSTSFPTLNVSTSTVSVTPTTVWNSSEDISSTQEPLSLSSSENSAETEPDQIAMSTEIESSNLPVDHHTILSDIFGNARDSTFETTDGRPETFNINESEHHFDNYSTNSGVDKLNSAIMGINHDEIETASNVELSYASANINSFTDEVNSLELHALEQEQISSNDSSSSKSDEPLTDDEKITDDEFTLGSSNDNPSNLSPPSNEQLPSPNALVAHAEPLKDFENEFAEALKPQDGGSRSKRRRLQPGADTRRRVRMKVRKVPRDNTTFFEGTGAAGTETPLANRRYRSTTTTSAPTLDSPRPSPPTILPEILNSVQLSSLIPTSIIKSSPYPTVTENETPGPQIERPLNSFTETVNTYYIPSQVYTSTPIPLLDQKPQIPGNLTNQTEERLQSSASEVTTVEIKERQGHVKDRDSWEKNYMNLQQNSFYRSSPEVTSGEEATVTKLNRNKPEENPGENQNLQQKESKLPKPNIVHSSEIQDHKSGFTDHRDKNFGPRPEDPGPDFKIIEATTSQARQPDVRYESESDRNREAGQHEEVELIPIVEINEKEFYDQHPQRNGLDNVPSLDQMSRYDRNPYDRSRHNAPELPTRQEASQRVYGPPGPIEDVRVSRPQMSRPFYPEVIPRSRIPPEIPYDIPPPMNPVHRFNSKEFMAFGTEKHLHPETVHERLLPGSELFRKPPNKVHAQSSPRYSGEVGALPVSGIPLNGLPDSEWQNIPAGHENIFPFSEDQHLFSPTGSQNPLKKSWDPNGSGQSTSQNSFVNPPSQNILPKRRVQKGPPYNGPQNIFTRTGDQNSFAQSPGQSVFLQKGQKPFPQKVQKLFPQKGQHALSQPGQTSVPRSGGNNPFLQTRDSSPETSHSPFPEKGYSPFPETDHSPFLKTGHSSFPEKGKNPFPEKGQNRFPENGHSPFPEKGRNPFPEKEQNRFPEKEHSPFPEKGHKPFPETDHSPFPETEHSYFPENGGNPFPEKGQNRFPGNGQNRFPEKGQNRFPEKGHSPFPETEHSPFPETEHSPFPETPPGKAPFAPTGGQIITPQTGQSRFPGTGHQNPFSQLGVQNSLPPAGFPNFMKSWNISRAEGQRKSSSSGGEQKYPQLMPNAIGGRLSKQPHSHRFYGNPQEMSPITDQQENDKEDFSNYENPLSRQDPATFKTKNPAHSYMEVEKAFFSNLMQSTNDQRQPPSSPTDRNPPFRNNYQNLAQHPPTSKDRRSDHLFPFSDSSKSNPTTQRSPSPTMTLPMPGLVSIPTPPPDSHALNQVYSNRHYPPHTHSMSVTPDYEPANPPLRKGHPLEYHFDPFIQNAGDFPEDKTNTNSLPKFKTNGAEPIGQTLPEKPPQSITSHQSNQDYRLENSNPKYDLPTLPHTKPRRTRQQKRYRKPAQQGQKPKRFNTSGLRSYDSRIVQNRKTHRVGLPRAQLSPAEIHRIHRAESREVKQKLDLFQLPAKEKDPTEAEGSGPLFSENAYVLMFPNMVPESAMQPAKPYINGKEIPVLSASDPSVFEKALETGSSTAAPGPGYHVAKVHPREQMLQVLATNHYDMEMEKYREKKRQPPLPIHTPYGLLVPMGIPNSSPTSSSSGPAPSTENFNSANSYHKPGESFEPNDEKYLTGNSETIEDIVDPMTAYGRSLDEEGISTLNVMSHGIPDDEIVIDVFDHPPAYSTIQYTHTPIPPTAVREETSYSEQRPVKMPPVNGGTLGSTTPPSDKAIHLPIEQNINSHSRSSEDGDGKLKSLVKTLLKERLEEMLADVELEERTNKSKEKGKVEIIHRNGRWNSSGMQNLPSVTRHNFLPPPPRLNQMLRRQEYQPMAPKPAPPPPEEPISIFQSIRRFFGFGRKPDPVPKIQMQFIPMGHPAQAPHNVTPGYSWPTPGKYATNHGFLKKQSGTETGPKRPYTERVKSESNLGRVEEDWHESMDAEQQSPETGRRPLKKLLKNLFKKKKEGGSQSDSSDFSEVVMKPSTRRPVFSNTTSRRKPFVPSRSVEEADWTPLHFNSYKSSNKRQSEEAEDQLQAESNKNPHKSTFMLPSLTPSSLPPSPDPSSLNDIYRNSILDFEAYQELLNNSKTKYLYMKGASDSDESSRKHEKSSESEDITSPLSP